ncbi:hypothetical protein [Aromatoleum aromaticum]|uniref:hypothetical protein n=1 Tax=Aromatoleum aromaticum TaxID=551760 RepID=UPI0018D3AEBF|nr:hypothetical protein [Aromatoleum aromaticum]
MPENEYRGLDPDVANSRLEFPGFARALHRCRNAVERDEHRPRPIARRNPEPVPPRKDIQAENVNPLTGVNTFLTRKTLSASAACSIPGSSNDYQEVRCLAKRAMR